MKSLTILMVFIITATSCSTGQKAKLSGEEIWNKYLDALGKKETVLGIKTLSTTCVFDSKLGVTKSKIMNKFPDKLYCEMRFPNNSSVIYIIKGDKGIVKSQDGVRPLTEKEISEYNQMTLIHPEMHYKQLGYKIELMGDKMIENKAYYNLKIKTDLKTMYYLINKENFQLFRIVYDNSVMEVTETILIDGLRLIKASKTIINSDTLLQHDMNYTLNPVIDDNIFNIK